MKNIRQLEDFLEKSEHFINYIMNMGNNLSPKYGEMVTDSRELSYYNFLGTVFDNLDENSAVGAVLRQNIHNITFFVGEVLKIFPELREQKVYCNDGSLAKIEFSDEGELGEDCMDGHVVYCTLNDALNEILKPMKEQYDEWWDLERYLRASCYGMTWRAFAWAWELGISSFTTQYNLLRQAIMELVDEERIDCDRIYQLIERFPVEFDDADEKRFDNLYKLKFDFNSSYIVIKFNQEKKREEYIGEACVEMWDNYVTKAFRIQVNNINMENYTLRYRADGNEENEFKIEWGEWLGKDECILRITPYSEAGNLTLNIYVEQNPEIAAMISVSSFVF